MFLAFVLLGCAPSSTDLQEPRGVLPYSFQGVPPSLEQIHAAILQGTAAKHWSILEDRPGDVVASVISGGHTASVSIEYDQHGWIIHYKDSSPSLNYDPDYRGRVIIHQRYNFWVRHLNRSIEEALSAQLSGPGASSGGASASTSL
jgi:hypothetical protein